MLQKQIFSKLFYLTLFLLASHANAATYYSRVATGSFATLSSWSISPTGSPTNATALTAADIFIIQTGNSITVAAAQTIAGITINTGGTLTVAGVNFSVTGTTSVSGTLIHNNATGTKDYTGLVTINAGGLWNNSGNSPISFRGGISTFNDLFDNFVSGSGLQSFTTNPQTLSGTGILGMTTVSLAFPLTNNLIGFAVVSGITGSSIIQGANSGFYFGNTSIGSTLDATAAGNTVVYYGAGAQTIKATTYTNLLLAGSGVKSFPATATTISSNLSINSGVSANLNTGITHTAGSLTLDGAGAASGTWGSTSSGATYKDNAKFSATTGVISVGTNTNNTTLRVTGVTICQGAATTPALNEGISTITTNQINGFFNTSVNATAIRPISEGSGFHDTTTCSFEAGQVRSYVTTNFQVSVSGNYSFDMPSTSPINGMGYIYSGNFVPGNCVGGGNFIRGDDDVVILITLLLVKNDPEMTNVPLVAGVNYTLVTTDFNANTNGATFRWDVTPPSGGGLIAPKWYNAATGGTALATGGSYNPVTAGVIDKNIPGTYHFWVGFDNSSVRTPVDYVISANSATLTSAVGTNVQNACVNAPITNITYTATGATGGSATGLPAGVTGVFASNVFTISGTPTATGLFSYTATLTGGSCGNVVVAGTISVSPVPVAAAGTAINCAGFTANWSSVTNATKYLLDISESNVFSTFVSGYNNRDVGLVTSYIISGLETGKTYYYRILAVSATCGNSAPSNIVSVVANATITNTWNGTAWSTGANPTITESIVFNGNYTLGNDLLGCSCTVNTGVNVTIAATKTLTITNKLTVLGTGTLTFKDKSSLMQSDNVQNTGNIVYERNTTINRFDYTYYSSPTTGQTLIGVSPETLPDKFLSFDGANSAWVYENSTSTMAVGKGYAIRGPQSFHDTNRTAFLAKFTGIPNNGSINGETVIAGKSYIVGNPYPSAIKVSDFLAGNLFLDGTVRFWTHNTNIAPSGSFYVYSSTDYAPCNGTGCALASSGGVMPNGYIAAGQSILVKTNTGITPSPIVFNNSMRKADPDNNSVFFKPGKEAVSGEVKIWLNFSNPEGIFKQLLVGYVDGATNNYEDKFDGITSNANPYADFYSICEGKNLVIQGRAFPFNVSDVVILGYRSAIDGNFSIAIDHAEGDSNLNVYLEDRILNVMHDLKASPYQFATIKGTYKERFVLRYSSKSLGTGDFEADKKGVVVSVKDKIIKVNSTSENIKTVYIYDVSGKLLYEKNKIGNPSLLIERLQSTNQILIVKVILNTNSETTKKIVF